MIIYSAIKGRASVHSSTLPSLHLLLTMKLCRGDIIFVDRHVTFLGASGTHAQTSTGARVSVFLFFSPSILPHQGIGSFLSSSHCWVHLVGIFISRVSCCLLPRSVAVCNVAIVCQGAVERHPLDIHCCLIMEDSKDEEAMH